MMTLLTRVAAPLLLALQAACALSSPPQPAPQQIPAPDPAEVERVVFLVGDPGTARREHYPILPRLSQDIEWWAQRLERDSAVTVLFLGDIVYPLGLHPPGHELYPHDSAIVMDQIQLLAGPNARERRAQGYFMAGNHDWGLKEEFDGFVRLKNLDVFLNRARASTGASVQLVPEVGTGGPFVLDLGERIRVAILDTAWWLLAGGDLRAQHAVVLDSLESTFRSAGDREILVAAHHPLRSAGPHGGEFSFWRTLGVRYLLARSGAILQDITSIPYRELERGLRAIFERHGPPLAFIGGHEHSLQVFRDIRPTDPTYSIVSGSASKVSSVGTAEGMLFGRSAPGYMRLVVEKDGGISLFVEAAPERFRSCPKELPERAACMAEGVAAFQTVHSQRLR
jgi:hypothetical protein